MRDNGLPVSEVGEWALEKYERLRKYVQISRFARQKFIDPSKSKLRSPNGRVGGATYIDLFSGPGKSRIRGTDTIVDGSPLVAYKTSLECGVPFSEVHVGDLNPEFCEAAKTRLGVLNATAFAYAGSAEVVARKVVTKLNPDGLHFAFLDPFNLGTLSFEIMKILSALKYIDLLVHVSVLDMQRNSDRYTDEEYEQFDVFAPGWRSAVSLDQNLESIRRDIFSYWWGLVRSLGFLDKRNAELIRGTRSQRLYWLVFVSRHKIANYFWDQIVSPQKKFDFGG